MLMIVLGAGATFDSIHPGDMRASTVRAGQPPLATELFNPREEFLSAIDTYRFSRGLIANLRAAVGSGEDVEAALERYVGIADGGDINMRRALLAVRFYLQQIIKESTEAWAKVSAGVTNYHLLVQKVERWRARTDERVMVVTFNYDRMLERAFPDEIGFLMVKFSDYLLRGDWRVFKLHGSVDWWRIVYLDPGFPTGRDDVIEAMAQERESDQFEVLAGMQVWDDRSVVPAIAIPTQTKGHFQCPDDHLVVLRGDLPNIDRALVIGWRGAEKHFLDLWHDLVPTSLRGLVVAENQQKATATANAITAATGCSLAPSPVQGFSELVRNDEILLSALDGKTP